MHTYKTVVVSLLNSSAKQFAGADNSAVTAKNEFPNNIFLFSMKTYFVGSH